MRRARSTAAFILACSMLGGSPAVAQDAPVASPKAASPTTPTPVMSGAEIERWETDALGFAERFNDGHPDGDAVFADFAVDGVVIDPTFGDVFLASREEAVSVWNAFGRDYPDLDATATAAYVTVDGAAFPTDASNLLDVPGGGPFHELRVFGFEDGLVSSFELLFLVEDLGSLRLGCFAGEECRDQVRDLAGRYARAWSAGDRAEIAALYREDATLADPMLAIDARGVEAISGSMDQRFGVGTDVACETLDAYAQMRNGRPVIGMAVRYRCTRADGDDVRATEAISVLHLGTRQGRSFDADPEGLIVHELVFHRPESLIDLAP